MMEFGSCPEHCCYSLLFYDGDAALDNKQNPHAPTISNKHNNASKIPHGTERAGGAGGRSSSPTRRQLKKKKKNAQKAWLTGGVVQRSSLIASNILYPHYALHTQSTTNY